MTDEIRGLDKIQVIGDYIPVVYADTGLWSLNRALGFRGELGIPLRSLFELYGYEASGKSTLAYYLSARVRSTGTIWIADLEATPGIKDYVREVMSHADFRGTVRIADYTKLKAKKTVFRSHEVQLQDAIDALLENEVSASIVDSIGAFTPLVECGKDLGERSVGQRAKTIADASRRILSHLRVAEDPKLIFIGHCVDTSQTSLLHSDNYNTLPRRPLFRLPYLRIPDVLIVLFYVPHHLHLYDVKTGTL